MKWKTPKHGDWRNIETFLLFPVNISGTTKWLETAKRRQFYDTQYGWVNWCWLD